MKDRKFHNKELQDNYPPPGVPADDAWAAMNSMLDAGLQKPPSSRGGPKIPGGSRFFMFSALLIGAVTVILLVNHSTKNSVKTTGKTILPPGTVAENATAAKTDSTNTFTDAVNKPNAGDTNYGSLSKRERSGKQTLTDSSGINGGNAGGKKGTLLYIDTVASREVNTIPIPHNNNNATVKDTRSKSFTKENKANSITGTMNKANWLTIRSSNEGGSKNNTWFSQNKRSKSPSDTIFSSISTVNALHFSS